MDAEYGILSEHEAAPDQPETKGYDPTPSERKAVKLAKKIFLKAKKARAKYDKNWRQYYDYFRGKQWHGDRPSFRHSEIMNFIFQHIQSQAPLQTDKNPTVSYVAAEPSDMAWAEIMNMTFKADWEKFNWLYQLTEVIYDGYFYGTGGASCLYDPDALKGKGAITFNSEDVAYFFPDPNARNVNLDADYFCYAKPVDTDKLKAQYPKKKEFIKPDLTDLGDLYGENYDAVDTVFGDDTKYVSPGAYDSSDHPDSRLGRGQSLVITCYIHDQEIEECEVEKEDGSTEYEQRLKYPNGRLIKICGNVLLEDREIGFEDKKFPFLRYQNYMDPRKFWGISEIEQLKSPQDTFNKLVSFSLDVLTFMGNPVWVIPTSSGIDTDGIFNQPGEILEPDDPSGIQRLDGGNLQPWVLQFIDRLKVWFDDISGSQDITRGAAPEGVKAASAIAQLQDAAQTRIRQKMRNLDAFMKDFGYMYLSRATQFYDAPRIFRITNNDNSRQYFKLEIDRTKENPVAKFSRFEEQPDGSYSMSPTVEVEAKSDLDIFVETGSSLPFAKFEREQRLFALFDRQIIDAQEVLDGIDYPNKERVLERMAQAAQAAAEAEAQAQMA